MQRPMVLPARCHRPRPALCLPALLAVLSMLAACRDPPETVLQNARDSLAELNKTACSAKERLPEAIDDFAKHVEPRAASIIRKAPEVGLRSAGQFGVFVTCKPPPGIIPDGDVVKVDAGDKRAIVRLKKKTGKGENEVPMLLVDGHWKLDLLAIPAFAKSMQLP